MRRTRTSCRSSRSSAPTILSWPRTPRRPTCRRFVPDQGLSRVAFKPFPYPTAPIAAPDNQDPVALGRYLADGLLDCYACHSADFKTNNYSSRRSRPATTAAGTCSSTRAAAGLLGEHHARRRDGDRVVDRSSVHRALKGSFRRTERPSSTRCWGTSRYRRGGRRYFRVPQYGAPIHKTRPARQAVVVPASEGQGKQVYYKYACNSCHGDKGLGLHDLRRAWKNTRPTRGSSVHQGPVGQGGDQDATWKASSPKTSTRPWWPTSRRCRSGPSPRPCKTDDASSFSWPWSSSRAGLWG